MLITILVVFLVRVNGYDKTEGFTYQENAGLIEITVEPGILSNGDIIRSIV